MDARFRTRIDAAPQRVFPVVMELTTYPEWLGIVQRAETATPHGLDEGPAWTVDLGARVGPFLRTKTVRMVRTVAVAEQRARFERREHDNRSHSSWVLTVDLEGDEAGRTRVDVRLHYSGAPSLPLLEAVLAAEARRAGRRLGGLVAQEAD